MVPEGWRSRRLGDLYDFKNGFNTEKANYGHGIKFANIKEVLTFDRLTADQIPGQVQVSPATRDAYSVRYGDVLFTRTSETQEEVGLASVYLDQEPIIFGGFVIRARPINSDVHPEFARYCFRAPTVRREIVRRGQGAIRANIGQSDLSDVSVTLPPLPEQERIAKILSTWDEAIEIAEKMLANAEVQKRTLMQQLLTGKRRLKGFERQDWTRRRLGDVLDIAYGKSPNGILSDAGNYPVVGTGGTTGRTNQFIIEGPVIVVGRKGTIDKPFIIETPCWPIDTTFYCEAKEGNVLRWVYYLLQTIGLRKYNEASGVPSLSRETLRAIHASVPSEREQKEIADILLCADAEVERWRAEIALLHAEKRALMQQLLTGKRRVAV